MSEQKQEQVFDLAAAIAEVNEKHPPVTITLPEGDPIIVPAVQLWPDEAMLAAAEGRAIDAVKIMLGDNHARYVAAGGTAVLFMQIFEKAGGMQLGESSAS